MLPKIKIFCGFSENFCVCVDSVHTTVSTKFFKIMQNFSEKPQNIFQNKWTRWKRVIRNATLIRTREPEFMIRSPEDGKPHRKWNPRWTFRYKYDNKILIAR